MKERLLSFEWALSLDQFRVGEFTRIFDESTQEISRDWLYNVQAAEFMQVPGPMKENLENLKSVSHMIYWRLSFPAWTKAS